MHQTCPLEPEMCELSVLCTFKWGKGRELIPSNLCVSTSLNEDEATSSQTREDPCNNLFKPNWKCTALF